MLQHILVPLDGSLRAERAIPSAARIAHAIGGKLTLLRVVTLPMSFSMYAAPTVFGGSEGVLTRDAEAALQYLKQLVSSRSELQGIDVATNVQTGAPAQAILQYAQANTVDLIIMCSHGDTGFKRWLLGSVALHVSRHSSIPVMVLNVRSDAALAEHPAGESSACVLLALDGSPAAEAALVPAAQLCAALAAPGQGMLYLTVVVPRLRLVHDEEGVMNRMHQDDMNAARLYLAGIEQRLHEGELAQFNLAVSSLVISGDDVADNLIRVAEGGESMGTLEGFHGCDLIAMATHGRTGPAHWVMGSVTARVLGTTKLPLLIVRPHLARAEKKAAGRAMEAKQQGGWVGLL
jgi:nucleotide-binding universal stress UspA family protein